MTIYQATSKSKDMLAVLNHILLNEGYEQISSAPATDHMVYKSVDENGNNEFYIKLEFKGAYYMAVSVYEKYVPGAAYGVPGVFTNGKELSSIIWSTTPAEEMDVGYIINVTRERLILFTQGEQGDVRSKSSLVYVGLPKRYDEHDLSGSFAGIAAIGTMSGGFTANWYALKGRALVNQHPYTYHYYLPTKAYGIGGQVFTSPIIIGHSGEGPRGELEDLLIVKAPDGKYESRHGDTFVEDGKKYILLGTFYNVSGTLPNAWYAIRIGDEL